MRNHRYVPAHITIRNANTVRSIEVRRLIEYLDDQMDHYGNTSIDRVVHRYGRDAVQIAWDHGFIVPFDYEFSENDIHNSHQMPGLYGRVLPSSETQLQVTGGGIKWARSGKDLP